MGLCARSRGSAFACTVGVSGFILHAHRTRGRDTRASFSLSLSLFLFRLFLSSLDWHFKPEQRATTRRKHPASVSTRSTSSPRRRVSIQVAANKLITIYTIYRSLFLSLDSRRQIREREERLPLLLSSNRIIISSPSSTRLFPHFIFPRFFVFLSRITVN